MSPQRSRSRQYLIGVVSVLALVRVLGAASAMAVQTNFVGSPSLQNLGEPANALPTDPNDQATLSPAVAPADLDAGKSTCPPDTFPDPSDHVAPPLDGPVADCIVPETDSGPGPIHKQAVPLPPGVVTEEQP
jgi:hypothetical protein